MLRNYYFYFVLRCGTNKNISMDFPCSGMTPKVQTVKGEWFLLKLVVPSTPKILNQVLITNSSTSPELLVSQNNKYIRE